MGRIELERELKVMPPGWLGEWGNTQQQGEGANSKQGKQER
jgi:hypothetical protein